MSLAAIAGIFGVIFILELPDKTMIATIVMSARARPLMVFLGASGAFVVHMAIATLAGGLLTHLPQTAKSIVIGTLFLGGAAYLLLVPEKHEEEEGKAEGIAEERSTPIRELLTAFSVIFVGEFGDLTQIQAANLVAKTHEPLIVFVTSSLALITVAALGSFAGQTLTRFIPLTKVRIAGGLIFLGLGVYTFVNLIAS